MQVKTQYAVSPEGRALHLQFCKALGISPIPSPVRYVEVIVFERPDSEAEVLHPMVQSSLPHAQTQARRLMRALLRQGRLGGAQVAGDTLVAQIICPGRNLNGHRSGQRIIWQWSEN